MIILQSVIHNCLDSVYIKLYSIRKFNLISTYILAMDSFKKVVTSATVSNYRASFKKQGMSFPNNRGRKAKTIAYSTTQTPKVPAGIKNESFTYVIDGTNVSFNHRPKTLLISKHRMLVEF